MGSVNTILQANNITRVKRAEYQAATMIQQSGNKKEAAINALKDFSRSLRNTYRVEAAGKEYNEAVSSLAGTLEGRTLNQLNSSLAAADKIGALQAGAAAQGVGGASVDLLNDAVELQRNIEQDLRSQETSRLASSGARKSAAIMDSGYSGIDLSQTFGNFDHTRYIEPKRMKRRLGKLIGVAVATYFGGPMAGEAVADIAVADWQNSNGNYAGAAQSVDSAVQHGIAGYKEWSSLQGDGESQSWFGAVTQKKETQAAKAEKADTAITWGSLEGQGGSMFGADFGSGWTF